MGSVRAYVKGVPTDDEIEQLIDGLFGSPSEGETRTL